MLVYFYIFKYAQIDLQTQLEEITIDRITQALLNDSSVLFIEAMYQDNSPTNSKRMEYTAISPKERTPPEITEYISREMPPPLKTKYEMMKFPRFFLRLYIHLFYLQHRHSLRGETVI